jgi:hypothetical protein
MTRTIRLLNIACIVIICPLLLAECNGQSTQWSDCKLEYSRASQSLNDFYRNKDETQLIVSLAEVDSALPCKESNVKAVDLKITLLLLLKRYKEGYEFVKGLDSATFYKPYQKMMKENWFMAHVYEEEADTFARDSLYRKIVSGVENYIESENEAKKPFDEIAYSDLLFVQGQFERSKAIDEIGRLEKKFPSEKDFFDGVREMLDHKPAESSAQAQPQ